MELVLPEVMGLPGAHQVSAAILKPMVVVSAQGEVRVLTGQAGVEVGT